MSPELFCLTTGPGQTMVCLYDCFAPQPLHDVSIGIVSYQALLHDVCSGCFAPTPFLLWIVSCQAILNTDLHKLLVIVMEEGVGRVCEGANSMALGCFCTAGVKIPLKSRYTPKSSSNPVTHPNQNFNMAQMAWCRFVTRRYTQWEKRPVSKNFEQNASDADSLHAITRRYTAKSSAPELAWISKKILWNSIYVFDLWCFHGMLKVSYVFHVFVCVFR